jgi:hypothetical protein
MEKTTITINAYSIDETVTHFRDEAIQAKQEYGQSHYRPAVTCLLNRYKHVFDGTYDEVKEKAEKLLEALEKEPQKYNKKDK